MSVSPFLLVEDVADRLHCSSRTVRELARTASIPHRRMPGTRRLLFVPAELEQWESGAALERVELPRSGRIVRPVAS